ncbi:MAG TPA: hypothetical protein VN814_08630 [Caulobacteraceae bacterium]|nr:hypothetical protein [Caulobacteraceae bacterium]
MFEGWDNYFVLLGTAAAGLIGLLFVVVTLTTSFDRSQALRAGGIYMTPIAVHFGVVLSISAGALVPRLTPPQHAILIAVFATLGFSAAMRTCFGIVDFHRSADPPHWSDFWGYGAAPAGVYLLLGATAFGVWRAAAWAPYLLAAGMLVLLLVAIRNAWDLLTWMAPGRNAVGAGGQPPGGPPPS